MRILVVGNFGRGWDGSICDEEHIVQALESLGHTARRWQREDAHEAGPLQEQFDFVLIAQWDGYPVEFVSRVRLLGCPIVYWAFDYQAEGQEWHERLVANCDLYLSKRIADSKYSNWQWLSQDFAPMFLDKYVGEAEKTIDVLFTGSFLPWAKERLEVLRAVDKQFNLVIYSVTPDQWEEHGFKEVHGPAMDQELPYLIAQSKINLAIDHTIEAGYWSDRVAQILCCGGFVLNYYVPLSEARFHNSIIQFYNVDDCLEKIQFFLDNQYERELVVQHGYEYAQNYLKVTNRIYDLLDIVRSIL